MLSLRISVCSFLNSVSRIVRQSIYCLIAASGLLGIFGGHANLAQRAHIYS